MKNPIMEIVDLVQGIKSDVPSRYVPPAEGSAALSHMVVDPSLVNGTRGYIEKVANQINGCYENGWYDGCAVMIRRLLETLIIECYEKYGIDNKIKDSSGNFVYLSQLVDMIIGEPSWNLGRKAKKAIPKLKDIGDQSAHSRRFVALRNDIEQLQPEIRTVVQELVYLSGLK